MLDFRMQTFLQLCETMNYRKTAERLNMTQPSVTQHIQYLEKAYGCKLFEYNKHTLKQTVYCKDLERKVRAAFYMEKAFRQTIQENKAPALHIGATKTIAEFVLPDWIEHYLSQTRGDFTLLVANTQELLHKIDEIELDFALIEGFFDKKQYGSHLLKKENFIGVCAAHHPFAGKAVEWETILKEDLIIREVGSGTRTIFEDILGHHGYSLEDFKRLICISHFPIIKKLVAAGQGITFGYESLIKEKGGLATFHIKGVPILREFNYVYLKGAEIADKIEHFRCI